MYNRVSYINIQYNDICTININVIYTDINTMMIVNIECRLDLHDYSSKIDVAPPLNFL